MISLSGPVGPSLEEKPDLDERGMMTTPHGRTFHYSDGVGRVGTKQPCIKRGIAFTDYVVISVGV